MRFMLFIVSLWKKQMPAKYSTCFLRESCQPSIFEWLDVEPSNSRRVKHIQKRMTTKKNSDKIRHWGDSEFMGNGSCRRRITVVSEVVFL